MNSVTCRKLLPFEPHRLVYKTAWCQGCPKRSQLSGPQTLLKSPPCSGTGTHRLGDKPGARTYTHTRAHAGTAASPTPRDLRRAQARQQGTNASSQHTSPVPLRKMWKEEKNTSHIGAGFLAPCPVCAHSVSPLATPRPTLPPHFLDHFLDHGPSLCQRNPPC